MLKNEKPQGNHEVTGSLQGMWGVISDHHTFRQWSVEIDSHQMRKASRLSHEQNRVQRRALQEQDGSGGISWLLIQ
ncbi:MAG: hypothetical protein CMA05_04780 [Euryarchaeota archaeon]|nr:hypothetical protein [Euryarchaeota archaeon]